MLSLSVSAFKTGTHTSHQDPELHVLCSAHILKWASHVWGLGVCLYVCLCLMFVYLCLCVSVSYVCVFI